MLSLVGLLGCPRQQKQEEVTYVSLQQATGAPPTLVAEVIDDEVDPRIRLSAGVAMAVTCWDYCTGRTSRCDALTVTSDDEAIVAVHDTFRASGGETFVLAAAAPGNADITVTTACGSKIYRANIE